MEDRPPAFPRDQLYEAAADEASRSHIDALHDELSKDRPSAEKIETHVQRLREQPALLAIVTNWFDDPRVQTFLGDLSSAGL
ncbi:MAG: hypothetical protein JO060_07300 [Candidatus Eremiobacteraeota bacterium]|nr:hypothetical protein [Candidatus Eremiobacteraeota bacterium]MBV9646751.1 hypothetical protein [Candidatus Eremiobacteraeota bacterium]